MRAALKIIVWVGTTFFGNFAILMIRRARWAWPRHGEARNGAGFGFLLGLVGAAGAVALLLARRWRGWLIVAGIIIGLPLVLAVGGIIASGVGEIKQRQYQRQLHCIRNRSPKITNHRRPSTTSFTTG